MSAENGELGVSHQTDTSVSQPGNTAQPEIVHPSEAGSSSSQPGETLAKTLPDINVNMGTMASITNDCGTPRLKAAKETAP